MYYKMDTETKIYVVNWMSCGVNEWIPFCLQVCTDTTFSADSINIDRWRADITCFACYKQNPVQAVTSSKEKQRQKTLLEAVVPQPGSLSQTSQPFSKNKQVHYTGLA